MRDELVREVADRLDVPREYVRTSAPRRRARGRASSALPAGPSAGEVALRAESEFLDFLLASGELGRATWRSRPTSSSRPTPMLHARATLSPLRRPARRLSRRTTRRLGARQRRGARRRRSSPPTPESVLRMSILQLEGRRIEREIRRAHTGGRPRSAERARGRGAGGARRIGPGHGSRRRERPLRRRARGPRRLRRPRASRKRRSRPDLDGVGGPSRPVCRSRRPSRGPRTRCASTCARSAACR